MDAGRMVNLAKNWTQVPLQRKCEIEGSGRYMQVFILNSFWLRLHGRPHEYSKAIGLTGRGRGPRFRCSLYIYLYIYIYIYIYVPMDINNHLAFSLNKSFFFEKVENCLMYRQNIICHFVKVLTDILQIRWLF